MIFAPELRVVVVEADDRVRRSLEWLLERCDPSTRMVGAFATSVELLAALPRIRPQVLALAANLPADAAPKLVASLRVMAPELRIVIITGRDNGRPALDAIRAGAHACVLMDRILEELGPAIHRLRRGEHWFCPEAVLWLIQSVTTDPVVVAAELPSRCPLSPRELVVLRARSMHLSYKEIGGIYDITPETARWYANSARQKLNARSVSEALRVATGSGWISEVEALDPRRPECSKANTEVAQRAPKP